MSDIYQPIVSPADSKLGDGGLAEVTAPDLQSGFLIFETKEERDEAFPVLKERLSSLDASLSKFGKRPLIIVSSVTPGDLAVAQELFPKAKWEESQQYHPCGVSEVNN